MLFLIDGTLTHHVSTILSHSPFHLSFIPHRESQIKPKADVASDYIVSASLISPSSRTRLQVAAFSDTAQLPVATTYTLTDKARQGSYNDQKKHHVVDSSASQH